MRVELLCRRGFLCHSGVQLVALLTVLAAAVMLILPRPPDACACDPCERERGRWFARRFDPSVPLLLTRQNRRLGPELLRYWTGLQKAREDGVYTQVLNRLFTLIPDNWTDQDVPPGRCRTCAVVGNSGNLKGAGHGRLIDQHQLVFRINKGPTEGYEQDVGSKVTHRMLYPESAVDLDNDTHLVLSPFKIQDLQWIISVFTTQHITRTYRRVRASVNADRHKVLVLHPAFIRYVHEAWLQRRGRYPSTGFLALVLALHLCQQVSVFGFGADRFGNWFHYFEKTARNVRTGAHSGGWEYRAILQLYQDNEIRFYRGLNASQAS